MLLGVPLIALLAVFAVLGYLRMGKARASVKIK
jgi:hypothetical protein